MKKRRKPNLVVWKKDFDAIDPAASYSFQKAVEITSGQRAADALHSGELKGVREGIHWKISGESLMDWISKTSQIVDKRAFVNSIELQNKLWKTPQTTSIRASNRMEQAQTSLEERKVSIAERLLDFLKV